MTKLGSRTEFYRGLRSVRARIAFGLHQALIYAHIRHGRLHWLRALVGGHFVSDRMTVDLRFGTLDAWMAHPGCERDTNEWIAARFDGSGTMIDVGAYCGFFSLTQRLSFRRIIALEASAENYVALVRNIALSDASQQIEALNAAASDAPGTVRLYLAQENTHSLIGEGDYEDVRAVTLDQVWEEAGRPQVFLVKIDVEGAEIAVLKGAEALLATGPVVIAEANDAEEAERLTRFMEQRGYRRGPILSGRNLVFERGSAPSGGAL